MLTWSLSNNFHRFYLLQTNGTDRPLITQHHAIRQRHIIFKKLYIIILRLLLLHLILSPQVSPSPLTDHEDNRQDYQHPYQCRYPYN